MEDLLNNIKKEYDGLFVYYVLFCPKDMPIMSRFENKNRKNVHNNLFIEFPSDSLKNITPFALEKYCYHIISVQFLEYQWGEDNVYHFIKYLKENLSGDEKVILMEFSLFDNKEHQQIYLNRVQLGKEVLLNLGEYRTDISSAIDIYEQYFKEYFFNVPIKEEYEITLAENHLGYCNLNPVQLVISNDEMSGAEVYVNRYYKD